MSIRREDTRVRRGNSCWSCELLCGMIKGHMIRCFCSCWSSAWYWAAPDSGDLRATKTPVIWIKTGSSWAAGVWASGCLNMVRLITVSISALQSNVNDDEAYLDYQWWGRPTEIKCPIWPSAVPSSPGSAAGTHPVHVLLSSRSEENLHSLLVPAGLDQLNHVPLLNSSGIWTAVVWFVWSWLKVQKLRQIRFDSSDLDNLNSRYYKIIILHRTHLLFKQHRNAIMEVTVSLAWKGFWWQRWGPLIDICSDISLLLPREASKSHFILRYSFMVASRGPAIQLIP